MAVVLEDTIIGEDGGVSDNYFWASPSTADPTYTWASGDKQKVASTPLITSLDASGLFALSLTGYEHGGVDGIPHAKFVNDRHDRIVPMTYFACGQEYANPGPNVGSNYGNGDGHRVECMFNPPQGDYMLHYPFSGFGTGTTLANFVFDPYDPIHVMDDDGHLALFIFSGLDPSVEPTFEYTPLSRLTTSGLSDTPTLTVDTPNANDYVIDVLIISRNGTSFTMEPSNAEQTVLFYHEPGHLISGFAEEDYFSGGSGALYQYYVSIRARDGATTNVGWDFLTGSGTSLFAHVAIVVRAL